MSTASNAPLSIAIVGVGRIGSAFAYQLARAGHDVTVVARAGSRRLAQVQRDRGIVLTKGERADVTVADHLDEQKPFDLVIVTVLAYQVDAVLPALQRSKARCVHFMFVTPEGERLRATVGRDRVTFGMPAVVAMLDGDGKLDLTVGSQKASHDDQRWVDLFQAAGMPSVLEPDMARWLRSQAPLTIAFEGVSAVALQHNRGATWAEAKVGARGLRAGYTILRELGETPYPSSKNRLSRAPLFVLTFLLWAITRTPFRKLGESVPECQGLIDLLTAEGTQKRVLRDLVAQVLELRPTRTPKLATVAQGA